jgi:signal transduction histidine kinase
MTDLTLESRMKLHDVRGHMHLYAGKRELKRLLGEKLDGLFLTALSAVDGGEPKERVLATLEGGRKLFLEFLNHDDAMGAAYDRIVSIIVHSTEGTEPIPLSLAELVRDEVAYFHRDLRLLPADSLVFTAHADPWVEGDETRLRRVLGNLLLNAVEALDGEGGVVVEVDIAAVLEERDGLGKEVEGGAYATLLVRDEGHGIPAEEADRVFEVGHTGKDAHLGLGLAFVKRVVEEMEGRIELLPAEPRGTAIRLYFPLSAEPEEPPDGP